MAWALATLSLLLAVPARADLADYPERLALRPLLLPGDVHQVGVEGGASLSGLTEVTLDADLGLSRALRLDVRMETESMSGLLLSPGLDLSYAITPDLGAFAGATLITDLNGVVIAPAVGVAARFHLSSRLALDIPGATLEYAFISGAPCLDPITAPSVTAPLIGAMAAISARCMNPNGLDAPATFGSGESLPAVLAVVLPLTLIASPSDRLSFDLGAALTYDLAGDTPSGIADSAAAPIAPLVPNRLRVQMGAWVTRQSADVGLHLGYASYFSIGSQYVASLELRLR